VLTIACIHRDIVDPVGVEDNELGMERDGFWTTLLRPVAELNA
jgi:hypothetical protein